MTEKSGTRVVRVSDEHIGALTQFIREVWDPGATEASVRTARRAEAEQNPATPGEEPPTYLFLREGRAIGHLGSIPARLWTPRGMVVAHWLKGFWVLPEFRSGPVGPMLVKAAVAEHDRLLSLAVAPAARRVLTGLGFTEVGALGDYVRPLRSRRLVEALAQAPTEGVEGGAVASPRVRMLLRLPGAAAISSLVLDLATAFIGATVGRPPKRVVSIQPESNFKSAADHVWEAVRADLNGTLRDGRYLDWRFSDTARYRSVLACRGSSEPVGMAVVRRPREQRDARAGVGRMASVVDIAFRPDDGGVGLRLIQASIEHARALDADAILCGASHPKLRKLLLKSGFFPAGAGVHLLIRERSDAVLPRELASWWITRGDGGADDGL